MTIIEEFASIVEIRKGRKIYLRKVILNGCCNPSVVNKDVAAASTANTEPNIQIIFVHGICGTEQQFQLLLQSMDDQLSSSSSSSSSSQSSTAHSSTTIACWLYDQVGCGQSPTLPNYNDYTYEETQADLKALLLAEQQNQTMHQHFPTPCWTLPTIVVGHSYGPSLFIPLLSEDPNLLLLLPNIIGFILINTSVRCPHLPIADGGHYIMKLPIFLLQCIQSPLTDAFIHMAVHPHHTELRNIIRIASQKNNMFVAKYYHQNSKWMTVSQLQMAAGGRRSSTGSNNKKDLVPTLIIHGTNDGVTPIECGQYMYNQLLLIASSSDDNKNEQRNNTPPVTFIAIDEASHMVMIEQPHQTAQAILHFIKPLL